MDKPVTGYVQKLKSGETVFFNNNNTTFGEQVQEHVNTTMTYTCFPQCPNACHWSTNKVAHAPLMQNMETQTDDSFVAMMTLSDSCYNNNKSRCKTIGTETDLNAVPDRSTLQMLLKWALAICSSDLTAERSYGSTGDEGAARNYEERGREKDTRVNEETSTEAASFSSSSTSSESPDAVYIQDKEEHKMSHATFSGYSLPPETEAKILQNRNHNTLCISDCIGSLDVNVSSFSANENKQLLASDSAMHSCEAHDQRDSGVVLGEYQRSRTSKTPVCEVNLISEQHDSCTIHELVYGTGVNVEGHTQIVAKDAENTVSSNVEGNSDPGLLSLERKFLGIPAESNKNCNSSSYHDGYVDHNTHECAQKSEYPDDTERSRETQQSASSIVITNHQYDDNDDDDKEGNTHRASGVEPKKPPQCNICGRLLHGEVKPDECYFCGGKYKRKVEYNDNMKLYLFPEEDSARKRKNCTRKLYECDECGKSFHKPDALRVHRNVHSKEKPFKCSICQKSFTQASNYKKHTLLHSNFKPFECSLCGKQFARKGEYSKHVKQHALEEQKKLKSRKRFECDKCGKLCPSSNALQNHLRIHSQEKPFKCNICQKCFAQNSNYKTHLLVHTKEKRFECQFCGKRFVAKRSLQDHLLIHKGEKPFKCKECQKSFRTSQLFQLHLLRYKHKG